MPLIAARCIGGRSGYGRRVVRKGRRPCDTRPRAQAPGAGRRAERQPAGRATVFSSDFMRVLEERGYIHQCTDAGGAGRARRRGARHRLHRLRLHGRQPARRQPRADHDAALAPEDRPPAHRPPRRRHDQDRRPQRARRIPGAAHRRGHRRQQGEASGARSTASSASATAAPARCWSTMPTGSTRSATSRCCATWAPTSRSTGC